MRSFVLVAMLAGCTTTTVQQSGVQAFCQIACDCGLVPGNPSGCQMQCESAVGTQPIPDACMSCIYEFEHECSVIVQVCDPDCQTQQATPLFERLDGGGP